MNDRNEERSFDWAGRRILLVGDVERVFLDAAAIEDDHVAVCDDLLDGVDASAEEDFCAVGVVLSTARSGLACALEALRDNCDGRIILLAQMHEEPSAINLARSGANGSRLADDYVICPTRFSDFLKSLSSPMIAPAAQPPAVAVSNSQTAVARPAHSDQTLRKRIEVLEKLATEDDLTGLKNRRYIWEFARQIIERAKKMKGRVTLLLFDIDNFKRYNDNYGHSAGDAILKQTAALIQQCCRKHDVVGRIGGDEFAVLFWDDPKRRQKSSKQERRSTGADHPTEAILVAKRLVRELEQTDLADFGDLGPGGKGVLAVSGGLASFPRDGATIEQIFEQADKALLQAKRSGKNRIYLVGTPSGDIAKM